MVQMREDGGARIGGRSGGSKKQSDFGYILKYLQCDFLMGWIWNVRGREESRFQYFRSPATGKIDLLSPEMQIAVGGAGYGQRIRSLISDIF